MTNRLYSRKVKCQHCGSNSVQVDVNHYKCYKCGHKSIIQTKFRQQTDFRRGGFSEPHDFHTKFKGKHTTFHSGYKPIRLGGGN